MATTDTGFLRFQLTTAEITYHLPDYPELLQSFVWQNYDLHPELPGLHAFLTFWHRNIDGRLHSVRVVASALLRPSEFRYADGMLKLQ